MFFIFKLCSSSSQDVDDIAENEKEVADDDKYIAEKFYTLQEVVDQLKKGTLPKGDQNDSSRQSPSKSRDKWKLLLDKVAAHEDTKVWLIIWTKMKI